MKKQILSTLVLSTVILAGAPGAFAEELVIGDVETVVTSPVDTEVTIGDNTGLVDEPVDTLPTNDGTVIGDDDSTIPKDDDVTGIVVEPTNPDESKEDPNDETVITDQSDESEGDGDKEEDGGTTTTTVTDKLDGQTEPTTPNEPKTPEVTEAEQETGVSTTGQAKPVTIPVIEAPIVTNKGVEIVGTQDGQVLVKTETGAVETKSAASVGAVKQSDGTVAVKDKSGKLQVLPSTGDNGTAIFSVIGLMSLIVALLLKYKVAVKKFFSDLG